MKRLVAIIGPTASGKTSLGIQIAQRINAEIINADSRQIYKYLNIGTAKPPRDKGSNNKDYVIDGINHHVIDFLDPKDTYSAHEFGIDANKALEKIEDANKLAIIVGGTGLYIDFLTGKKGSDEFIINADLREKLNNVSLEQLQEQAIELNLEGYIELNNSDQNNPRRLIRFIEKHTNPVIDTITNPKEQLEMLYIMPDFDLSSLYDRINIRVDEMFEEGFLEEVKEILSLGYDKDSAGLQTMGYSEVVKYLVGENSLNHDDLLDLIKIKHRNYAKRQITWFKKYDYYKSIQLEITLEKVKTFLNV